MSTIIKIKKSSGSSAPGTLATGELAYTYGTGTSSNLGDRLFIGTGTETDGEAANIEVVGGKYFIDLLDHTHGNVTASSALIVDSNSKLDVLSIDNLKLDGNTISNTDTNGDINITPNGTGSVVLGSLNGLTVSANQTISMGSNRVTNVADPTGAQDSATKSYVDATINGLDVKDSVRVGTTANLSATYNNSAGTLTASASGAITVDSVSLSVSDRILVKNQTTATQNGIYEVTTVGSGSVSYVLTRTADGNTGDELSGGVFFFVEEGTLNGDNGYVSTHNGTPTLGTTSIVFGQFSGAGQISAGAGMTKNGNTLDVEVDGSSIEIVSDALNVKAAGITNAMLFGAIDLTTKVTGTLPMGNGGTGATSFTSKGIVYGNGIGDLLVTAAGTWDTTDLTGQFLSVNSTNVPTWTNILDGGTF